MRILVTGGAGYIGSHVAKALAHAGHKPIVFDSLVEGHRWAVRWGPLVQGDLADGDLLREVMREYEIDAVIHLAASAYVGESVREPRRYFRNNVTNTLTLLDAMLDAGVRHLVFSSSCATYGVPRTTPIREDHPQYPVNPYGDSKLFVERALHWYSQAYGLRWVALRYFNAAGADPDQEIGERHRQETHLIPSVILAALGHQPQVEVYGTDYPTPDGTAVRDYVHVTDLADAHVRALTYLANNGESCAINLGTGQGHSVNDIIGAVESATGRRVPRRDHPRREGDPPFLVADVCRAKELLGWRPRHSTLDELIVTALRWYSAQPGVAKIPA